MNYELIKNEFIQLKKEELSFIDSVAKTSKERILSEKEKLEIYRKMKKYERLLNDVLEKLRMVLFQTTKITHSMYHQAIVEFNVGKDYLSSVSENFDYQKYLLEDHLHINSETYRYTLTLSDLLYYRNGYRSIDPDRIQNGQQLLKEPIYVFNGYCDYSEDVIGPCFGDLETYLYGVYKDIRSDFYSDREKEIPKKDVPDFEKGKIIIPSMKYVRYWDIKKIFDEELLNEQNQSIEDCILTTRKRVQDLNYRNSPEYKTIKLLDKVDSLYEKVRGKFIQEEVLYSGSFLKLIRETYQCPNQKIIQKEKVEKNEGKNSVIIIPITQNQQYLLTFQNRIPYQTIAEFPSGYIEDGEDPVEAAKRELLEETGYTSDDIFLVDEAFTSPGIDNSISYIVIANDCWKVEKEREDGTEFLNYGLFSKKELEYLVYSNTMNGAMNKLAFYNLILNVKDGSIVRTNDQEHHTKYIKKTNPFED